MKPEDKFGKPIYNHIYSQLLNIGMKLERNKYKESKKKHNLFYKVNDFGTVYADMRGTEEVPIWTNPVPLVYYNFHKGVPIWRQTRVRKEVIKIFDNNEIPYRYSFYEFTNSAELVYELEGELADKERKIFGDSRFVSWYLAYDSLPDGYCKGCGKDIKDSLYHCSKECRDKENRKILARTVNESPYCEVCKKKIIPSGEKEDITDEFGVVLPDRLIDHHIRYFPEKKIKICASCHGKIHHSKEERLKLFLPVDSKLKKTILNESKKLWKWWARLEKELKKVKCKKCGHLFAENKQKCPKCKLDKTHARRCEKCDNVFNDYGRTTCPKCRTFFR